MFRAACVTAALVGAHYFATSQNIFICLGAIILVGAALAFAFPLQASRLLGEDD